MHLPEFLKTFGHTYHASRLPWTVMGWLLHSAFDDATALYVLHFAVFYPAVFSLYVATRVILANTVAAGATALVLGTHTYFLIAVDWDYVDGASLACMLAAFAALASAAIQPRWRLAALMWGVATCAMVSMYVLLVLLVPLQAGLFFFLNRLRDNRAITAVAVWFVAGGSGAMLVLLGRAGQVLVAPFTGGWTDIGTFATKYRFFLALLAIFCSRIAATTIDASGHSCVELGWKSYGPFLDCSGFLQSP
jgi:hypothetical protein